MQCYATYFYQLNQYFRQGSVYFASCGKSCAGAILPLAEHNWLKLSHDKYDTQTQQVRVWVRGLTPWPSLPVYKIFVLWHNALSHYFWTSLQLHNLPSNFATKLFKTLKDAVSLGFQVSW